MTLKLLIGNKTYSSWSLRPWILLKQFEIPFTEEQVSFNAPDFADRVRCYSPAGKVPVLVDGDVNVWDSLAIAEYLAERFPEKHLWPEDRAARAQARSICAEMHAGFQALRSALPMNCSARFSGILLPNAVNRDIARILSIWRQCQDRFGQGGPFMFGRFTIPDAYYSPIVRRFLAYNVKVPEQAASYVATVDQLPSMRDWIAEAAREADFVPEDEPYRERA